MFSLGGLVSCVLHLSVYFPRPAFLEIRPGAQDRPNAKESVRSLKLFPLSQHTEFPISTLFCRAVATAARTAPGISAVAFPEHTPLVRVGFRLREKLYCVSTFFFYVEPSFWFVWAFVCAKSFLLRGTFVLLSAQGVGQNPTLTPGLCGFVFGAKN